MSDGYSVKGRFIRFDGLVHLRHPHDYEYSLCGSACDSDISVDGDIDQPNDTLTWQETKSKVITCPVCAAIIVGCRGVRVNPAADPAG